MRSKNSVPVQIVLPGREMGNRQTVQKAAFEEALHSTIEANLRSSGVAPSHIFSSLYLRSFSSTNTSTSSTEPQLSESLSDKNGNDTKPDISHLQKQQKEHSSEAQAIPQELIAQRGSQELRTGVSPFVTTPFVATSGGPTSDSQHKESGSKWLQQQQHTSTTTEHGPAQQQQIVLKDARVEHFKKMQQQSQLHTWKLLQQQQLQKRMLPRNAGANTLLQAQMAAVARPDVPRPKANGITNRAQFPGTSASVVLPTSPMFRKGYCKGGSDIRLSTLEKNSAGVLPYPSTFALVAMTITPVPINTPVGNDALVVAAVNLKCMPMYHQDTGQLQGAVFAQCIGCGDRTLGNFAMLASHTNLRLQTSATTDVSQLLRRHARFFVSRNPLQPQTLVKGAVIPWNWSLDSRQVPSTQASGEQLHGTRMQNSLPMLVAPYMNMYMAHAAAAKQTGDGQTKNNMLYSNVINKITHSASNQPIVVNDEEETSKISSFDSLRISDEYFSQFDVVPVILNVIPNVTFDLKKSLSSGDKEIHVFNQLHEIFQNLSENCNLVETSTSTSCKFQCFSFFLYLNSLGSHEPVSGHSYASFMRSVFDTHTNHLTSMLENVSPLNTLSLAQFLTQNMAKLHVSQVSFGHALHTFFNSTSESRCNTGASCHVIAHANDTSITGMCLVITDGLKSQLTQESLASPADLQTNVISNIKKVQTAQFKEFWSLLGRMFPHKQPLDSHNDDPLVIDTMVTDDDDKLSSRQQAHVTFQRNTRQQMIDDMQETFTEKVLDLICDDSSSFHLMHFASIRCRFLMPSHYSCVTQAEQAVTQHDLQKLYGESDTKQMILTANENRINLLQEEINTNSTELFIIFSFLQSKEQNPTQSPHNSPFCNDIRDSLLQKNVLFIQCTDNQYFEPKTNHTAKCNLFVNINKHVDYFGVLDHCVTVGMTTHQQTLTHCEQHEAKWRNIIVRGLGVHSYDARTSLVMHEYTQAMYKVAKTQQTMTNIGTDIHDNSDSGFALNIIMELVSCSHVSCVLRIPSMSVATLAYLQLRDVRDRLSMTKQFEIILYNPSARPSMSNQYLKLLQERRNEDSTWRPSSLAECNCIPVLAIYAGDVCLHHQMPSSLHSIDLRLSWLNAHPSTTALGREMSLLSGFYRFPSSKRRVSSNRDDTAESPPSKKRKDSGEESNDGGEESDSSNQALVAWKSMEEGSPTQASKTNGLKRSHDESVTQSNPLTSPTSMEVDTNANLPRPPTAILPQSVFNTISNHVKKNPQSTIPDDKSPVLLLPSTDEAVVVNVAFPPRSGFVDACCGFATNVHSRWRELCQIEVYSNSCDILPNYPVSHESNKQPDISTLREMPFTVVQPNNQQSTVVYETIQSAPSSTPHASVAVIPGDYAAFNKMHRMCDKCLRNKLNTGAEIYSLSIPDVTPQLLPPDEDKLIVELIIPKRHSDKFVFLNGEVSSIKFTSVNEKCLKTPVLSFAVSGVEHGLFNLNHTLATSSGESTEVLHMLVVRSKDADSYRSSWPNMVLMILPEEFDDYSIGAMKYAAHKFFIHCYDVQSSVNSDDTDILWPFIMFMNDNCALWWKYSEEFNWSQTSLHDVIERMESTPGVEQVSVMGVSPWRSENRIATEGNTTNRFSRSNLSSCFAINVNTTKDKATWKYDMFLNEDLDFCLSVHNHDLLSLQFNDVAVATKVIKSPHVDNVLDRSSCLVSTADSDFELIDCHPRLLLETYMSRDGPSVFNSSTLEHPIAVVDGYLSFGPNAFVEYVSSLSTNSFSNKRYGGLFLNSPTPEFPDDLLQKLQFIEGAAVCVVDKDRNSLRQTVVNLNLERRWHFRLTDEFQTTNKTNKHKPLFFLTGIFKN